MKLAQTVTWIPVEERLPDSDVNVFIATAIGTRHVGYYNGKQWRNRPHSTVDTPIKSSVTHWAEPLKHPNDL